MAFKINFNIKNHVKLSEKKSLKIDAQPLAEENLLKWDSVQLNLKETLGTQIYTSWLKNIRLLKEFNHYVVLGVQTRFFRDWITSRYADKILDAIKKYKIDGCTTRAKIIQTGSVIPKKSADEKI